MIPYFYVKVEEREIYIYNMHGNLFQRHPALKISYGYHLYKYDFTAGFTFQIYSCLNGFLRYSWNLENEIGKRKETKISYMELCTME